MLDYTKYYVSVIDWLYYHGSMFEPTALFFHPQIWGKYPIIFYFLLYDVVSKPFLKTAVICIYCCSPSCFFRLLFLSSATLSVPLLPGRWAGLSLVGKNGDGPISEALRFFVCFLLLLLQLSLTSRTFVIILWIQNYRRDVCMVYRHRFLTYTVATTLSCSNNVEFGTGIDCTKASCVCAERFLWSCFVRAQWLSVFNAVLPLPLGY